MEQGKTLYRSRDDQMIAGVCAGIADYFELDPTVVRLIAVFLLLIGNVAIVVAYIVLMIVVPESPGEASAPEGRLVMSEQTGTSPSSRPGPDSPPPPPPRTAAPSPHTGPVPPVHHSAPVQPTEERSGRGSVWLGVALIFVGVVLLIQVFVPQIALWQFWPVIIIVAGLLIIFRRGR